MTIVDGAGEVPALASAPALMCRRLRDDDLGAALALLGRGFPERSGAYWRRALGHLRDRAVPDAMPRYGYILADAGRLVGIVLVIFSRTDDGLLRGNVSSWYVEPAYRAYSSLLLAAPMRLNGVTLVNISPAPGTLETMPRKGSPATCRNVSRAALMSPRSRRDIRVVAPRPTLAPAARPRRRGCFAYEVTAAGEVYPFVFAPSQSIGDRLPCAQLVYCRRMTDFVRFAGPLGRRLARRGLASVMLDANGPIAGVPGRYIDGKRSTFYRGAAAPRLGDLSYTELALFGA